MKKLFLTSFIFLYALGSFAQSDNTRFLTFEIKDTSWTLIKDTVVNGKFYTSQSDISDILLSPSIYSTSKDFKIKQISKNGTTFSTTSIANPYDNMFDSEGKKKPSIIYVAKIPYKKSAMTIEVFNGGKKMKSFPIEQ